MFVYICVHITGASRCDNCVAGKYSTTVGATVASTCINCLAGKYSADSGMSPECQLCGRQVSTTHNWCASEE